MCLSSHQVLMQAKEKKCIPKNYSSELLSYEYWSCKINLGLTQVGWNGKGQCYQGRYERIWLRHLHLMSTIKVFTIQDGQKAWPIYMASIHHFIDLYIPPMNQTRKQKQLFLLPPPPLPPPTPSPPLTFCLNKKRQWWTQILCYSCGSKTSNFYEIGAYHKISFVAHSLEFS